MMFFRTSRWPRSLQTTVSPLHTNEFCSESPFISPICSQVWKVSLDAQLTQLAIYCCCCSGSQVRFFFIPRAVALQVSLSMRFPRQEYWGGLPFPSPGDLPDPGSEPKSPVWQEDSLPVFYLENPGYIVLYWNRFRVLFTQWYIKNKWKQ